MPEVNKRFLWDEGDLTFSKCDIEITDEQTAWADAAINDLVKKLKEIEDCRK